MNIVKTGLVLMAAALLLVPPADAARAKKRIPKTRSKVKIQSASGPTAAVLQEAMTDMDAQDFDAAISKLSAARSDCASSFLLGYAYYQRGFRKGNPEAADKADAQAAADAFSKTLNLDPKLSCVSEPYRLYHSLAMAYEALGNDEQAVQSYKDAFLAAPDNPMLPLYAARLRLRMGDSAKSAANLVLALKKARQLKKATLTINALKADPLLSVLLDSAENRRIIQDVENGQDPELSQSPEDPASEGSGLRDAIRDQARSAAAPDPVLSALASADDRFKAQRYGPAIFAYESALDLDSSAHTLKLVPLAIAYERLGTSYSRLGQSEQAITALRQSLRTMPSNPAASYQLALAYSVAGKFSESLHALNEAFRAAPARERSRYLLMAKAEPDLASVRDLASFRDILNLYKDVKPKK
ncbi:MAG: tetratricopeptide repeat protein [Elusimicrobiota bacterium]|jgi:tetratricopeptide (TPR) repeat protein